MKDPHNQSELVHEDPPTFYTITWPEGTKQAHVNMKLRLRFESEPTLADVEKAIKDFFQDKLK